MSRAPAPGAFVTFEGCEGCGKTTQLALFVAWLRSLGLEPEVVREPGGTRVGEAIRDILLDCGHSGMDPRAELLLYEASRAQLVSERIAPALERGAVVVCDRFFDSTTAYQGYGRGLPPAEIAQLNHIATGGRMPDLTLVFDLDAARGLDRATAAGADRLEAEELAFHERVRAGFRAIALAESDRVTLIDAEGTPEEVHRRVREAVRDLPALAGAIGETA